MSTGHPGNEYRPASTDADLLPVVDENDAVIGSATRAEVHARRLMHRAVHVVVLNPHGELLLQRRSMAKDLFPGWWDISVGGHVDAGEDYADAVVRELREEMGISAHVREVAIMSPSEVTGWEFQRIYECTIHSDPTPNPAEVSEVRWATLDEVRTTLQPDFTRPGQTITPGGLASILAWAHATGRT